MQSVILLLSFFTFNVFTSSSPADVFRIAVFNGEGFCVVEGIFDR